MGYLLLKLELFTVEYLVVILYMRSKIPNVRF